MFISSRISTYEIDDADSVVFSIQYYIMIMILLIYCSEVGVKWEAEYENRRKTLRPLLKKYKEYVYHNL